MKRVALLSLVTGFAAMGLHAQCLSGDCRNGSGIFLLPDGARYIGEFVHGAFQGAGTCYYMDGSIYRGKWKSGLPNGMGAKTLPDGTFQEGIWNDGKWVKKEKLDWTLPDFAPKGGVPSGCIQGDCLNGKGIYALPTGDLYSGDFKDGEIHGFGVCYFWDGSKYQGQWVRRYPEGKGTMTYFDGSQRTGYWRKGQPIDPSGNLQWGTGRQYNAAGGIAIQFGCISGDCNNGQGVHAYPDGSRYDGIFKNGKPDGFGTFFYANNDQYSGTFRWGYPHGKGKMIRKDGSIQEGEWRQGEYAGNQTATYYTTYGCIKGDCHNGYGVYIFRDGTKYSGSFSNYLPHGKGMAEYSNGEKYEGEMALASFNGWGILTLADGKRIAGFWKDGRFTGSGAPAPSPAPPVRPAAPARAPKVWAVIVGIAAYNHMPALRYTDDDAYRMYAFLKSPEGGALPDEQIRILIDEEATRQAILSTMEELYQKAGSGDLVFLYFSGHGLRGAFLPIDFDGINYKLMHEEINAVFERSRAKFKLCIVDACHSGSLLAMRGTDIDPVLANYYQSLAQSAPGTALILSSKSDETSLESSGLRQGVFSHFLIRGLKGEADTNSDQIIGIQELFDFVFVNVRNYTANRQSPVIKGLFDRNMTVAVRR